MVFIGDIYQEYLLGVGELAFQRNHQVIEEFGRGHGQDPVLELADMQNPVTQVTPVNWNGLEPLPQRSRYRNGKGCLLYTSPSPRDCT